MSVEASTYVVRHVRGITTAQRAILDIYANLANAAGRTRISQYGVAQVVELCRRQVERHCRTLRELGHLARRGRNWYVVGVADTYDENGQLLWRGHDLRTCEHPWCVKQYQRECRPKVARPRRVADPDAWQRLPRERPQPATTTAAAATSPTRQPDTPRAASWRSKFKRRGGRPP